MSTPKKRVKLLRKRAGAGGSKFVVEYRNLASMFFWCCGRKDELREELEDEIGASDAAERLLASAEEAVGGAKVSGMAKARGVEADLEQTVQNTAASLAAAGQSVLHQPSEAETGKENHRPSVQAASVKVAGTAVETVTVKQPAVADAASAVVTGIAVTEPAAAPSTPAQGEQIVRDIAVAAPAVQETAKAAVAAAAVASAPVAEQAAAEASTSAGTATGGESAAPKKPAAAKKKGGKKKGSGKSKKKH